MTTSGGDVADLGICEENNELEAGNGVTHLGVVLCYAYHHKHGKPRGTQVTAAFANGSALKGLTTSLRNLIESI